MSQDASTLAAGDRVRAARRPGFPDGTVVKILEHGLVLVRWDGDVLETAHPRELTKLNPDSTGR